MKVTSVLSVLPPLMEFMGGAALVAALWYGSGEIAAGRLTTGEFSAFIAALFLMYGPAKKLSRVNSDLQQAIAAGERIFEMLDTHSEVQERPDAITQPPFSRVIRIQGRPVHVRRRWRRDSVAYRLPSGLARRWPSLAAVARGRRRWSTYCPGSTM